MNLVATEEFAGFGYSKTVVIAEVDANGKIPKDDAGNHIFKKKLDDKGET